MQEVYTPLLYCLYIQGGNDVITPNITEVGNPLVILVVISGRGGDDITHNIAGDVHLSVTLFVIPKRERIILLRISQGVYTRRACNQ